MKYKDLKGYLIAVDLDGTLISNINNYDKLSLDILKEVAKNNLVVIATGRPYRGSKFYYDYLELTSPIINYNGAWLHNPCDNSFPKKLISIDKNILINFTNTHSDILETVFCELEDDIFLLKEYHLATPFLHLNGGNLHVGSFDNTLNKDPNGAIIFSKKDSKEKLDNYIQNVCNNEVCIRYWFVNECIICEFYNPLTSKANALKEICKYYNIDEDKTICIGDGSNDIEMIDFAKIGVAMKNSHPELLKHADIITDDVSNHGVFNFFMKDI